MISSQIPQPNTPEVSLFGPGIGECIVLHIGQNRWFIIDSCLSPATGRPIALEYFDELGVDVSTQVEGIIITHWHKDHIDGAYELVRQCNQAQIYLSAALLRKEAIQLGKLYKKDPFASTDLDIREFGQIIDYLRDVDDRSRIHQILANYTIRDSGTPNRIRLLALSPSSSSVTQSLANIVESIPLAGDLRIRRVIRQSENHNAVALYFAFDDFKAILGSDLEESGNSDTGWSAIIDSGIQAHLSLERAQLFKVPHHGSANGHHNEVWSQLLNDETTSIVTPHTSSGLPKDEDIDRLKAFSSEVWLSRNPHPGKPARRDAMVEREMRGVVKSRFAINDRIGHIQVRINSDRGLEVRGNGQVIRFAA